MFSPQKMILGILFSPKFGEIGSSSLRATAVQTFFDADVTDHMLWKTTAETKKGAKVVAKTIHEALPRSTPDIYKTQLVKELRESVRDGHLKCWEQVADELSALFKNKTLILAGLAIAGIGALYASVRGQSTEA